MICDKRVAAKVKGKVYKTVVRPADAVWFGDSGTDQEVELEVAELKILRLRFSLGMARTDRIRTRDIRWMAQVGCFGDVF